MQKICTTNITAKLATMDVAESFMGATFRHSKT